MTIVIVRLVISDYLVRGICPYNRTVIIGAQRNSCFFIFYFYKLGLLCLVK